MDNSVKKHFVRFFSPGTFVSEYTDKEIDSWDVERAKKLAHTIKERHGATPYGFKFITRERGEEDLDSKITKSSGMYFLGGRIRYLDFIMIENNADEQILISNMQNNGWDSVVENTNSWKVTLPLEKGDTVLDWSPKSRKKVNE